MRGLRSVGLFALFVGAEIVGLVLALPFKSAGLASTSNANNLFAPLLILIPVVGASVVILLVARYQGGRSALRLLILAGIAGALYVTLAATFALVFPAPFYAWPPEASILIDLSLPAAASVASVLLVALLIEPQWWIVDLAGFLAAGSLIALLGISFGVIPAIILLVALAIYDAVAVYGTKHMISLAEVVTDLKLPILMVMPSESGYDYPTSAGFSETRSQPIEEREAMYMGLGDVIIPGTLVVSAFVWLPTTPDLYGLAPNVWVTIGTLLGLITGYFALMRLVARGTPQAGLPLLNSGAILGFLLAYLLVFHNLGFGSASGL